MIAANSERLNRALLTLTVLCGAGAILHSALRLPATLDWLPFLLLTAVSALIGTRVGVETTRGEGQVTLADTLTIFAMMVFGGEAAVLLCATAGLCAGPLARRRLSAFVFNLTAPAAAAFVAYRAVQYAFGHFPGVRGGSSILALAGSLCLLASAFALAHVLLVKPEETEGGGLSRARGFGAALCAYFCAAAAAGVFAELAALVGFYVTLSLAALLALTYFVANIGVKEMYGSLSEARQIERRVAVLQESEELFRSAFDYAAIGMALVSSKGQWLQVNRSLCDILGYEEAELLSTTFQKLTHPDDLGTALANIKQLIKGKLPVYQMEKRYLHKQGHAVWVLWSVSPVRERKGGPVHLIFQIQDITDRKRAEERLLHDAFHDALTGLPNRSLFVDHLKLAIARMQRNPLQMFAVIFLDLDRFKIINDSLGHMIGDQLLVGIARRLEGCLRPGDTVARVGGDEFTILIEDVTDASEAVQVAERIQRELTVPFRLGGREVFTTASIGVAPGTTEYAQPEDVLRDADTAMYRAKSLGKARHEVFDKEMHTVAMNLLQMETDLRGAIDRQEFFVQYQPIVALDSFNLRGFEALVRWQHPTRGLISPMDFIPVAEETGQIVAMGQWALREACRQMSRWQRRFPSETPLFISVNLSSRQFTQPDLIEQVRQILAETKLDPRCLKLEITESVVMENIDKATEMLRQLRQLGVRLAIDDFGTGYSSLSYLHRFPIDTLKVDRSFVMRMVDNNENIEIVRTILMLAQNLGMDVVAEGVETKEQLALLRKLGCENGQGYFFSRPVSVGGAEKIITETAAGTARDMSNVKVIRPSLVA